MNIKNILRHGFVPMMALCAIFSSCSEETTSTESAKDFKSAITCEVEGKNVVDVDKTVTRSALDYDKNYGMVFKWTDGDWLTVFAKDNDNNIMNFRITGGLNTTHASFTSKDFELTKGVRYYSLSKSEQQAERDNFSIPSQNNISLNFAGQVQKGNASPAHLGKYDFMSASSICEENDNVHFSFKHLGATLRMYIYADDAVSTEFKKCKFSEVEVYDSEHKFVQPKRTFSFAAGTTSEGYSSVWPDITPEGLDRFTLTLKNEAGTGDLDPNTTFADGSKATNPYSDIVAYMEVPPFDFTGKTIVVMLKGKYYDEPSSPGTDISFVGTRAGLNVESGNAYKLNFLMKKPDVFNVALKINHKWQWGNDVDITRATTTGDPGYDDDIQLPSHIYYIYCVDEKVRAVQQKLDNIEETTAKTVNSIIYDSSEEAKKPEKHWTTDEAKAISTFIHTLTFAKAVGEADNAKRHLYVVASTQPLTIDVAENDDEETVVRALQYSIQGTGEAAQIFMRDLYSTPYASDATFPGNLTDPMQDVFLYHVAAKVDVKWNSTTTLTGNVSVNHVKNENLSLFMPTTNTYGSIDGEGVFTPDGSYSPSATIDPGMAKNGRYVFYLPQFANPNCTYSVTIGSTTGKIGNIKFTPVTTNGFTSWLRTQVKQQ